MVCQFFASLSGSSLKDYRPMQVKITILEAAMTLVATSSSFTKGFTVELRIGTISVLDLSFLSSCFFFWKCLDCGIGQTNVGNWK